jgi:PAS domain S-box-containing protein
VVSQSHRAGLKVGAHSFPSDDAVLAEHVRELLGRERRRDPSRIAAGIEARLRAVYPNVRASVRSDVAGFGGDTVIYVFREGSPSHAPALTSWIEDPATARVVTDATGMYVEANDAAARLFGSAAGSVVGTTAGTFTRPDARVDDANAVWAALDRTQQLHSFALLRRQDGSETRVEFVTLKDGDGPGRNVTYLRECR